MATKRRSYGATKQHHAADARHHASILRSTAKHVRAYIKYGRCEKAADALIRLASREGQYADARYYGAKKASKRHGSSYQVVTSLKRRFIEKCVK